MKSLNRNFKKCQIFNYLLSRNGILINLSTNNFNKILNSFTLFNPKNSQSLLRTPNHINELISSKLVLSTPSAFKSYIQKLKRREKFHFPLYRIWKLYSINDTRREAENMLNGKTLQLPPFNSSRCVQVKPKFYMKMNVFPFPLQFGSYHVLTKFAILNISEG